MRTGKLWLFAFGITLFSRQRISLTAQPFCIIKTNAMLGHYSHQHKSKYIAHADDVTDTDI